MQKNIIALAIAAAFAAPAAAMAEATFYGSMDGGVRHQINDNTGVYCSKAMVDQGTCPTGTVNLGGGGTTDSLKMGQYNTARWGFKMVEDMGDGLKTNVVLETSLAPAGVGANQDLNPGANNNAGMTTGTSANPFGLIFDRQATIGLEGGLGKFDMGWTYSTSFKTLVAYDALGGKLLGLTGAASTAPSALRNGGMQVNVKFGDIAVNGEYVIADAFQTRQPAMGSAGRALGVSYNADGLNVGAAYTTQEATIYKMNAALTAPEPAGDNSFVHVTAGAGYKFGDSRVTAGYAKKTTKPGTSTVNSDSTATTMWAGYSYDLSSAIGLTAAYYSYATNSGVAAAADATKKTMIVAATYALSKKTQLYFEADRATANSGVTDAKDVVTSGLAAGLSTVF